MLTNRQLAGRDSTNATGDPSAAERSHHQAIAVAKLQSAKLSELRASMAETTLSTKSFPSRTIENEFGECVELMQRVGD
jgi:hypothetical protein